MGDKENRSSRFLHFLEKTKALALKSDIPNREGFINNEDVRVCIYGRCESEPDIHTARVGADWMLNKFTDPGEFNDMFKAFLNLFF